MAPLDKQSQINYAPTPSTRKWSRHLSDTIERLARAGEQAGFSVEQLIELLNAGVSIGALLDMISYSLSREAPEFTQGRAGGTHELFRVQAPERSF